MANCTNCDSQTTIEQECYEQEIFLEEEPVIINQGGAQEVYRGPDRPSGSILIWIDTSGTTPTEDVQFLTSNNEIFMTSNNENFIVRKEI